MLSKNRFIYLLHCARVCCSSYQNKKTMHDFSFHLRTPFGRLSNWSPKFLVMLSHENTISSTVF